ncbi:hypothetical protein IHN32_02185 [Deinococcus sp. 14RED07]|uniref:hypothetical protein n=1 Tax=Deinococcus sp. 14RED07 TaxID=2745874 RepID=UPI001E6238AA|nr:hypothetical protein [Deinococcus sp. 14RED07]MCD0174763.1 hypothetical protein [Deinococcus sp. 14RED07]
MNLLVSIILTLVYALVLAYCARNVLFVLSGTARNYAEWSQGLGGFLYLVAVVVHHVHPGTGISWVAGSIGFALVVLPDVLHWLAPRLYQRLTENC